MKKSERATPTVTQAYRGAVWRAITEQVVCFDPRTGANRHEGSIGGLFRPEGLLSPRVRYLLGDFVAAPPEYRDISRGFFSLGDIHFGEQGVGRSLKQPSAPPINIFSAGAAPENGTPFGSVQSPGLKAESTIRYLLPPDRVTAAPAEKFSNTPIYNNFSNKAFINDAKTKARFPAPYPTVIPIRVSRFSFCALSNNLAEKNDINHAAARQTADRIVVLGESLLPLAGKDWPVTGGIDFGQRSDTPPVYPAPPPGAVASVEQGGIERRPGTFHNVITRLSVLEKDQRWVGIPRAYPPILGEYGLTALSTPQLKKIAIKGAAHGDVRYLPSPFILGGDEKLSVTVGWDREDPHTAFFPASLFSVSDRSEGILPRNNAPRNSAPRNNAIEKPVAYRKRLHTNKRLTFNAAPEDSTSNGGHVEHWQRFLLAASSFRRLEIQNVNRWHHPSEPKSQPAHGTSGIQREPIFGNRPSLTVEKGWQATGLTDSRQRTGTSPFYPAPLPRTDKGGIERPPGIVRGIIAKLFIPEKDRWRAGEVGGVLVSYRRDREQNDRGYPRESLSIPSGVVAKRIEFDHALVRPPHTGNRLTLNVALG
ncbi:MAG: hypothetical protein KJO08_10420, partial [Gammaproteobacteria bacterium]|nr:hypothetical protein [Gammaproteobacteria bacterium]